MGQSMRGTILAGGAASRFGGKPKGLEKVGGERILDRVVKNLQAAAGQPPLLIANAKAAKNWRTDLKVVPDMRPNLGTLGGIYTALTSGEGPVILVAWDMPFVSVSLLQALIKESEGFDAFLPEGDRRHGLEPLCAVYRPSCVPAIENCLDREDLRAIAFHPAVKVGRLPPEEVAKHGNPDELFFNVNTPDDLTLAEELWRRLASSR